LVLFFLALDFSSPQSSVLSVVDTQLFSVSSETTLLH
jgi:hypothetical protein